MLETTKEEEGRKGRHGDLDGEGKK